MASAVRGNFIVYDNLVTELFPYRPFGRHCICRGDCGRHPGPAGAAM